MWLALAALAVAAPASKTSAPGSPTPPPTCDSKGLLKALTDAGPSQAGKAYADLAACDPGAANKAAADSFKPERILAGDSGDAAAVAAISVGASEAVRTWVNAQEPDDRSRTINKLGEQCDKPGVPGFFLETQKSLGEKFWTERWYRGLDECRDSSVQELLRTKIAMPGSDRTLFFGVVEVFSRNLGKDAIPPLKAALANEKDPEVATYLVNAFADAAGVGRAGGADPEAVKLAVAAINEVAPTLPPKAVEQARNTLLSLDAEADSDKLVRNRYKDQLQASGGLLYGIVTTEIATCKKGDTRVAVHTATINEGGHTWPDQVKDRVAETVKGSFKLDLAGGSCKGTETTESVTPLEPFKSAADYQSWVDATLKDVQKKHPDMKIKVIGEDPLNL